MSGGDAAALATFLWLAAGVFGAFAWAHRYGSNGPRPTPRDGRWMIAAFASGPGVLAWIGAIKAAEFCRWIVSDLERPKKPRPFNERAGYRDDAREP